MKLHYLKTKDSVKVGSMVDSSFRSDRYELSFEAQGFFKIALKGVERAVFVPASNVSHFEVEKEAMPQAQALKKKAS